MYPFFANSLIIRSLTGSLARLHTTNNATAKPYYDGIIGAGYNNENEVVSYPIIMDPTEVQLDVDVCLQCICLCGRVCIYVCVRECTCVYMSVYFKHRQ